MPPVQNYLVGLDLGSSRTRCVAAIEEESRLRFISYGSAAVDPRGWDRGAIVDQDPVLDSLEAAVEEAERNGGVVIDAAVVGVGGSHVQSNISHASIGINSWETGIEKSHIDEVVKTASQGPLSEDRVVVQAIPLEFSVDQQPGVRNPLGMSGRRLDAHVQVISALAQAHDNIRAVVNRAGVRVEETIAEPFAAAYAVLEEQEREMGVLVADLGAQSADLLIYLENDLRLVAALPFAGAHCAKDVASVFKTPVEDACRLVEQYGSVLPEQTPEKVTVEIPTLRGGLQRRSRRELNEILRCRAEEILLLARGEVARAGYDGRLVAGVVLTGSLACLAGICDLAEEIFDANVRIGLPPRLEDLPDELDHPGWAASIGLLLYAQRLRLHQRQRRDRVTEWLKALFE